MNDHTPGPWKFDGHFIVGPDGDDINHLVDNKTYIANETLKAAAPEMLKALIIGQDLIVEMIGLLNRAGLQPYCVPAAIIRAIAASKVEKPWPENQPTS